MAIQPIHRTREQLLVEALGERIPVKTSGHFTLYSRSKTTHAIYVHDKRNGPESLPVTSFYKTMFGWHGWVGGEEIAAADPGALFEVWLERRAAGQD